MVGGRLMGVRADNEAGAAVDEMGEAHLLRGRLGMEVEHHGIGLLAERTGLQRALPGLKRIVELGLHEDAAHDVRHEHAGAVSRHEDAGAAAGRSVWKIGGPQEALLARRESERLALVPDVIAGGHDVRPGIQRFAKDLLGDAEAAGRVLTVDDDEVEPEVGDQAGQAFPDRAAAGPADHVAKKKQSHRSIYTAGAKRCKPVSVRISGRAISCGSSGTRSTRWQSKAMPTSRGLCPLAISRAMARS